MRKLLLIIVLLVLVRLACDKIKSVEESRKATPPPGNTTFVVDQNTGKLVRVPVSEATTPLAPQSAEQKPASAIEAAKTPGAGVASVLPETSIPGKRVKMRLRTNWLAGKLRYVFQVYPYESFSAYFSGQKRNPAYANREFGFEILLADSKSVVVHRIPIDFWSMAVVSDEQGERTMLMAGAQINCSADEFERLALYSVSCNLDLDALPSIPFDEEMSDLIARMPEMYGKNAFDKNSASPGAKYWLDAGDGIKRYFSTREELEKITAELLP